MSKKPIIISNDSITKLNKVPLNSNAFPESYLQELLYKEPEILPTSEIESVYSNLIPIGREVPVKCGNKTGYIDNFYISSKGFLVIVETKLWRNPESRREVVSQIIDYATDIQEWDYEQIDNIYKQNHNKSLFQEFVDKGYYKEDEEAGFVDVVSKNISSARFLLLIVGDGIRESVEKMVEFLNNNSTMQYRLALCELEVYDLGNDKRLVIPNLSFKTKVITRGVLRIENNKIKNIEEEKVEEQEDNSNNRYLKTNSLSLDEWVNTKLKNKELETELRKFLEDIEDYNLIYNIGTSDLNIKLELPQYNKKLKLFMFFGGGELVGFQPYSFYIFLDTYNYSRHIADELLNGLKKYISNSTKFTKYAPYENERGYYYIDIDVFLDNKEDILSLIEKFISNL